MIERVSRMICVMVLLASASPACQVPSKRGAATIEAGFQIEPTTQLRFVDIGETDYRQALTQLSRSRRGLDGRVFALNRLDAKLGYLGQLQMRQTERTQLRKHIEMLEWERSEAERYGKTAVVEQRSEEIDQERSRLADLRRVYVRDLMSVNPGYGLFLLDLRALEASELQALAARLDIRADAYRDQASGARALITGQGPGRRDRNAFKPLPWVQEQEEFSDQMAADLTELARTILAGEIDAAQTLADRKWVEACSI